MSLRGVKRRGNLPVCTFEARSTKGMHRCLPSMPSCRTAHQEIATACGLAMTVGGRRLVPLRRKTDIIGNQCRGDPRSPGQFEELATGGYDRLAAMVFAPEAQIPGRPRVAPTECIDNHHVRPHGFYSSVDKYHVGRFGSGHCPAPQKGPRRMPGPKVGISCW